MPMAAGSPLGVSYLRICLCLEHLDDVAWMSSAGHLPSPPVDTTWKK